MSQLGIGRFRWIPGGGTLILALALMPSAVAALTMTDQTGRAVSLEAPPRRIVSLVPSVTEILFAIGAQDLLVGVTDFCDYPPEARRKPRVGGMVAPDLEALVALRPDLVIATPAGSRHETFAQIERLRIPVYLVNATRVEEVLDLILRLAAVAERRAAAAPMVASLRARVRAVAERVAPLPRPRVLYVVWPEPLIVPGRGSLVSELIALAGGESVTAGWQHDYPRLALEAAVARAPEVILLASHGAGQGSSAREAWERFGTLPAIRAGRVHAVSGDVLHRYGPRVIDGLEELARFIHPEAFGGGGGR